MGVGVAWGPRRQFLDIAGPDLPLTCLLTSSFAEQLVLYLKVAELLSSGLQTAIGQIRAGKLCLSSTVKQGEDVGSGMRCWGTWVGIGHARSSWQSGYTGPGLMLRAQSKSISLPRQSYLELMLILLHRALGKAGGCSSCSSGTYSFTHMLSSSLWGSSAPRILK